MPRPLALWHRLALRFGPPAVHLVSVYGVLGLALLLVPLAAARA